MVPNVATPPRAMLLRRSRCVDGFLLCAVLALVTLVAWSTPAGPALWTACKAALLVLAWFTVALRVRLHRCAHAAGGRDHAIGHTALRRRSRAPRTLDGRVLDGVADTLGIAVCVLLVEAVGGRVGGVLGLLVVVLVALGRFGPPCRRIVGLSDPHPDDRR